MPGSKVKVLSEFRISMQGKTVEEPGLMWSELGGSEGERDGFASPHSDDSESDDDDDNPLWIRYDKPVTVVTGQDAAVVTDGGGFACLQRTGGAGHVVLRKVSCCCCCCWLDKLTFLSFQPPPPPAF